MIADRRYLAAQVKKLQRLLSELNEWVDNPDGQFPGDAVALADEFRSVAELMLAANDEPDLLPNAQTQVSDALELLFSQDRRWQVVPSPGCVTITRGWPDGAVDTLIILSPDTAYGRREDAREREVWAVRGTLYQVLAGVGDLPDPSAPDTPNGIDSAGPSGYWI